MAPPKAVESDEDEDEDEDDSDDVDDILADDLSDDDEDDDSEEVSLEALLKKNQQAQAAKGKPQAPAQIQPPQKRPNVGGAPQQQQ